MESLEKIRKAIIETMPAEAKVATEEALAEGLSAKEILDGALIPGMDEVGKLFREGDCIAEALLNACKGDLENGFAFCGSEVHRISGITTVKKVIDRLFGEKC